ncbi:Leucine-rich repeat domain-containing protein [Pseudomonas syringae pv. cilantro]|uniref:RING-type E3 ubiquitin transferase n=2 Tax=Pseudomonas syringae group TaxID=136849 RepID=A0A0N1JNA5_PSESX|nr:MULTISPECIES: NEL-type E3 ubiquitin ligase domain-containing protein [Pseudomonas syringae group]KPC26452.1 Leucine-rich repeat domain-containing protein [Pseudomonas syringae pv. cilantro]RMN06546.1 Leucine-rich repeat domain-containing protein [Pseudomonas syringae pv. coriandricola]
MLDSLQSDSAPTNSHVHTIKNKTPDWLLQAGPTVHATLRKSSRHAPRWLKDARTSSPAQLDELQRLYAEHRRNEQTVGPTLDRLSTLEDFAKPLLTAAIKERFGLDIDVANTWLFHASRATVDSSFVTASRDPITQANAALKAANQTLLAAALQNFEAWETAPGAMDSDAGTKAEVFSSFEVIGNYIGGKSVPISPMAFAALCRELDLGGKYQAHLKSVFSAPSTPEETSAAAASRLRNDFMQLESSAIRLQLQIAALQGLVSEPLQSALLQILDGRQDVRLDDRPVNCSVLCLGDVELNGLFVIGKDRDTATALETIVVYIPDDPIAPLKEYASVPVFINSLRDRMFVKGYLNFFKRFIPARHRNAVLEQLFERLHPKVRKGGIFERQWLEREEDRNARLHLRETPLSGPLLEELYDRKQAVLRDDALFQGVPTADEDQKTFDERVQYFKSKALDVLNIASFVVPVLGELMLAVTAAQLIHEVYEGVESWAKDEKQQALDYLFDVVENIALMAALGAATAGGAGIPALHVPEFARDLKLVELPDGTTRLWKPDLTPFAHDIVLPASLQPDAAGLYTWQGKQWLPLEGRTYSVKPGKTGDGYRMQHPTRADSYQPALRHNGAGAWLHELDQPLDMEGLTLFRRLGYSSEAFSDTTARHLLNISNTSEAAMRQALADQVRPPALLEDSARRFRLDQAIDRFIEQMAANDPTASAALQLELLSQYHRWPNNRALTLVDAEGNTLQTFPPPHEAVTRDSLITIRVDQPDALRQALEKLSNLEIRTLLDEEFGAGQPSVSARLNTLRATLTARAKETRAWLFESRYRALNVADADGAQTLQNTFSGLPPAVVQELVGHATPVERAQLITERRVPLRIAEEASVYMQHIRLARAYEGLYLTSVSSADTDCLALHSLEALPQWPSRVRLEVHNRFFGGPLIDSIGPQDAPIRKVLIKDGNRYEARDADDRHLHGLDDLYSSVLHALPDAERNQLGFPHTGQGQALAALVQNNPLPRQDLAPLLNMQAIKPGSRSPMRLADGRLGYPLSGRGEVDWHMTDESLLDKIRILELEDAFPEDILSRLRQTGWNNREIDQRLNTLLGEQLDLRASLTAWTDEIIAMPPMSQAHIDSRERISEAIWSHWRLNNLPEIGRTVEPLRLQYVSLTDFPRYLPDFVYARVTGLHLENISIEPRLHTNAAVAQPVDVNLPRQLTNTFELGHFLQRFPNARSLHLISEPSAGLDPQSSVFLNLPQWVSSMLPQLDELGLINQGIFLDQMQMNHFRSMPNLRTLDLSGNRVVSMMPMDLDWLHLDRLVLERVGLHRWPNWLTDLIPNNIRELSVAHNNLTELPGWILDNPPSAGNQTLIDLRGNSLSRHTAIQARINESVSSRSFRFVMDTPLAVQAAVNMQLQQGAELIAALDEWSNASSSLSIPSEHTLAARRQIGAVLINHWRTFSLGQIYNPLRFADIALVDFPRHLPEFFYRQVRHLHLNRITGTAADLDQLLRPMTELSSLEITGHVTPLGQLPPALLELRALRSLSLNDQGLVLDQQHIDFFSRLPRLERLELENNRLGAINSLSGLRNTGLTWLSLNNVEMSEWPAWLDDLVPGQLTTLLLESNLIHELPENILANPHSQSHTEISLMNNPLSEETMRRAQMSERYGRAYTFDMDVPQELAWEWRENADANNSNDSISDYISEGSRTPTPDSITVEPWLDDANPLSGERRQIWEQLEAGEHADHLLELISSLRQSSDYRNTAHRAAFQERVWRVLAAVNQDPQLRMTLNAIAEEPVRLLRDNNTCSDGVLLEFNQIEVLVFTRKTVQDVVSERRGAALYQMTVQLYRLSELDAAAREQAGTRDEAEVRLAYRTHWASALELPVPPGGMLFEAHAALRPGELDTALLRVQTGEQGDPFLSFAAQQDYWVSYLREAHPGRFDALERLYRTDLTHLTDEFEQRNINLDSPEYEARIREFEARFKDQQATLIRELTNAEGLEHR